MSAAAEVMPHPVEHHEQDFDLDPTVGVPRVGRSKYVHLRERFHCGVCGSAPILALSDYGYMDFTLSRDEVDDDEPEWVGLCWGCAKPIVEGEGQ